MPIQLREVRLALRIMMINYSSKHPIELEAE
jgi:hypothetical protein